MCASHDRVLLEVVHLAPGVEQEVGVADANHRLGIPLDQAVFLEALEDAAREAVVEARGTREVLLSPGPLGLDEQATGDPRALRGKHGRRTAPPDEPVRLSLDQDAQPRSDDVSVPGEVEPRDASFGAELLADVAHVGDGDDRQDLGADARRSSSCCSDGSADGGGVPCPLDLHGHAHGALLDDEVRRSFLGSSRCTHSRPLEP